MADPRALLRVFDELLWALRREGFDISTAQAIDAARALLAVGLERRADVRDAVGAVVVQRARDRTRFDAGFDRFFAPDTARDRASSLWDRLAARGFDNDEIETLRALLAELAARSTGDLAPLGTLLGRGAELDRALMLGGVLRHVDAESGPQLGFLTHRLLSRIGSGAARRALASLRPPLVDAIGARGEALADALAQELDRTEQDVRAYVRQRHDARVAELDHQRAEHRLTATPFAALTEAEVEDVRRAVRRFAERLRGGAPLRGADGSGGRRRSARRPPIRRATPRRRPRPRQAACAPRPHRPAPHAPARAAHRRGSLRPRAQRAPPRPPAHRPSLRRQRFGARGRMLLARAHVCGARPLRPRSDVRVRQRPRRDDAALRARARSRRHRPRVGRRHRARRRQFELRPCASYVRGATRARDRPPHHGRDSRRRTHQLSRRRGRRARSPSRAVAGLALALPGAARNAGPGRQRDGGLRPEVLRGVRSALRRRPGAG